MADDPDVRRVIEQTARDSGFSGVVRVDRADHTVAAAAFGLADRRHRVMNTVPTRFGIASGSKGFTALTVMSLVADGTLDLQTPARRLLGSDLPAIDDHVTVEHLLAHRSGIGDYIDESADGDVDDYVMSQPVHALTTAERFLAELDGQPQRESPGDQFRYNNSGFVVLALVVERATGRDFHELVAERVLTPAGMTSTAYLRSDALPADAAIGYLRGDGMRSNVLHLPVVGSGDGGAYSTADDVHRLWQAYLGGLIVPPTLRRLMIEPVSEAPIQGMRYGLGFWLHPAGSAISLEGMDPGVSFRSVHDPVTATTHTTISNTSTGTWPMTKALDEVLGLS